MCDELKEFSEFPRNLTLYELYKSDSLPYFQDLEDSLSNHVSDLSFVFNKTTNSVNNNFDFDFKFKNCYDSLDLDKKKDKNTTNSTDYDFVEIFFSFVKKGLGIAEIVGSSGSGKTSICLKIAHQSPGTVLYLDLSGSFDYKKSPTSDSFIHLRLYSCEELILFLIDLDNRLLNDLPLCDRLNILAREVEMIIVDSLWSVDQSVKFHQQEYLFNLSLVLRKLSWKYNISIVVCINNNLKPKKRTKLPGNINSTSTKDFDICRKDDKKSPEIKKFKDTFLKWNSNCYIQFLLNYKTLNYRTTHTSKEQQDTPLVYRIMHIYSGTLSRKFKFIIGDDDIMLEDI